MEILFSEKNTLQDLLSSLNAVISTNESTQIITGHVIYNLAFKVWTFWEGHKNWKNLPLRIDASEQRQILSGRFFQILSKLYLHIPTENNHSILLL